MNSGEIVDKDLELFAAKASPVKGSKAQNSGRQKPEAVDGDFRSRVNKDSEK